MSCVKRPTPLAGVGFGYHLGVDPVVAAALVAALGLAMAIAIYRRVRRDRPDLRMRGFLLFMVATSLITGLCAWAFTSDHPAVGIALLVVGFVMPNLVRIPLHIRAARKQARESAARRRG